MLGLASLVLGVAIAAEGAGGLSVSPTGPGLAVVAQGAPLRVVLEEIGRQSGISVTYDGPVPTTPLTCDFVAATPAQAFLRVLEGSGLNYALRGGTRDVPGILLVSASAGPSATRTTVTASQPDPAEEVAMLGEPGGEAQPLVAPPPGGAIPPRFMQQGEEPAGDGSEDGSRPSGETGMSSPETPSPITGPSTPGQRRGARERPARGGPGNSPQN